MSCINRLKLLAVADHDHLSPGAPDTAKQDIHVATANHGGLIKHDHVLRIQVDLLFVQPGKQAMQSL